MTFDLITWYVLLTQAKYMHVNSVTLGEWLCGSILETEIVNGWQIFQGSRIASSLVRPGDFRSWESPKEADIV